MTDIVVTYPKLSGIGGIETVLASLLRDYYGEDLSLSLFLPGGTDNDNWMKNIPGRYKTIVLHHKKNTITQLLDTLLYVVIHKPKAVIVMGKSQIIACYVARLFNHKLKIISWNHFSINVTRSTKILWLFRLCDAHLCISSGISRQLRTLGIDKKSIFTVYNPIKKSTFLIPRSGDNVKKLYYIGRIQYERQKNTQELLQILALLEIPWRLTIIGTGEKKDIDRLKTLARDLNIDKNIIWLGWVKDPWEKIKVADAVVLSSNYEGLPMILCEAIAHGVPVFSSNCETGPEDIIVSGVNGELYKAHDITDGRKKLESMLNKMTTYSDAKKIAKTASKFSEGAYFSRFKSIVNRFLS